jgi:hypothetical protein
VFPFSPLSVVVLFIEGEGGWFAEDLEAAEKAATCVDLLSKSSTDGPT